MHLDRELQDMVIVTYYAGFTSAKGMSLFAVSLIVFIIPELLTLFKRKKMATTSPPNPLGAS